MTMPLDEFAKKLIEKVRDETIAGCESTLKNPYSRSPMRLKLNDFDQACVDKVLELVIPKIIDKTIFNLLQSIEGGDIRLVYVSDEGVSCDLEEEGTGELAGWLYGDDGWIASYSTYEGST